MVVILEREREGGQCVHRSPSHHLQPEHCSMSGSVVEQDGETDLPLLVEWLTPLVRRSIYYQKPLKDGMEMPWLLMRKHVLKFEASLVTLGR